MVLLQSQRQEVPKWSQTEPSSRLGVLESNGDGQANSHIRGGDQEDWSEEGTCVLQGPGTQRRQDQLDYA